MTVEDGTGIPVGGPAGDAQTADAAAAARQQQNQNHPEEKNLSSVVEAVATFADYSKKHSSQAQTYVAKVVEVTGIQDLAFIYRHSDQILALSRNFSFKSMPGCSFCFTER